MKILMILTSHDALGDTGKKTGFWLEEFVAPYYVFRDAGADVTLSDEPDAQTDATRRFRADSAAAAVLAATHVLGDIHVADYDAVFYPGGHGPLWDLANDAHSIALIETALGANQPVGLVCHAPGALKNVRAADGSPLVKGRRVSGFTNSEEAAVGLTDIVPFLVEDMLTSAGGIYSKGPDWASYAVEDGQLITGQNPASSAEVAMRLLGKLARR
jgi:putative intracellular protease/amidase